MIQTFGTKNYLRIAIVSTMGMAIVGTMKIDVVGVEGCTFTFERNSRLMMLDRMWSSSSSATSSPSNEYGSLGLSRPKFLTLCSLSLSLSKGTKKSMLGHADGSSFISSALSSQILHTSCSLDTMWLSHGPPSPPSTVHWYKHKHNFWPKPNSTGS